MRKLIFLGPTLDRAALAALSPDVSVRGPAAAGDVYRAVREGYLTIALVDGLFDQQQSVWHKEILWALTQRVVVYGAASMGALRAAELSSFGMRGVGRIFQLFEAGLLERDDEVAVIHGSAEVSFRPLSVALVNMRFTLRAAVAGEVVRRPFADAFCKAAEELFYAQRSYAAVLDSLRADAGWTSECDRLAEWLGPRSERAIDQKRNDALQLLEVLGRPEVPLDTPSFELAQTEAWFEFMKRHAQG